jgi:hypothetical protein
MKRIFKSKKALVLLAVAVAAIAAVGGYAFFTNSGSGTGSATVGSSSAITISGTSTDALYPAGPAVDVTITVTNPSAGAQKVDTVHFTGADDADATCDTSVFSMPNVPVGVDIPAGESTQVTGHLSMADNGQNQNSCQGDALTLNFTSN